MYRYVHFFGDFKSLVCHYNRIIVDILFGFAACDPELMPSFPQHRLKRKGQTEKDK